MYRYDEFDHQFVQQRTAQFRDQANRRLSGALTEDEFRPLRLMNGLYLQLHAYMLRVAIPYGTLSSKQMRQLAYIADKWDRGYGHFTTRQNIQYNWIKLEDTADILSALAEVEMHAIYPEILPCWTDRMRGTHGRLDRQSRAVQHRMFAKRASRAQRCRKRQWRSGNCGDGWDGTWLTLL
jgi:hypothetical protein